jgi:hypothetical protein
MKSDLKRIEAALQQVSCQTIQPETLPSRSLEPSLPFMDWDEQVPRLEAVGMPRWAMVEQSPALPVSSRVALTGIDTTELSSFNPTAIAHTPNLPEFVAAVPESSRQQAMAAPALATNLLGDLQNRVQEWTLGLQEILEQIQALYREGPVIKGQSLKVGWSRPEQPIDCVAWMRRDNCGTVPVPLSKSWISVWLLCAIKGCNSYSAANVPWKFA